MTIAEFGFIVGPNNL